MRSIARVLAGSAAVFTASAAFAQMPGYQERAYQERPSQERPYQEAAYPNRAMSPQQELDQILAPVALYPDSLLSQLLMAATYPRDVADAARWSRNNPGLQGDDAVRAVEREPWDPSVKSLVAFPEVLAMMGEKLDWTQSLGEAFLSQEDAVMRTVQQLRRRADEAGNLRSSEQIMVERAGDDYVLAPPSPETVYVPYYDPRVVYGAPWWPDYQPVYWNPWPGYAYYSGIGFGWGHGISLHRNFFYGGFDWGRRHVRYSAHRPYYYGSSNYWRGWRDHRRDGRRYSSDRSPGTQPRYDRRDGPQRSDGGTRADNGTRQASQRFTPRTERGAQRIERADGSTRYNPPVRAVAPRYGIDRASAGVARSPIERSAQVQRAAPVQRAARVPRSVPQSAAPNAGMQRNSIARPAGASRAAQPAQRAAQPSQRSSGSGRGGGGEGNRGGGGSGSGSGHRHDR
jgi:hypothetical protein